MDVILIVINLLFSDPYQMFGPTSSRLASSGKQDNHVFFILSLVIDLHELTYFSRLFNVFFLLSTHNQVLLLKVIETGSLDPDSNPSLLGLCIYYLFRQKIIVFFAKSNIYVNNLGNIFIVDLIQCWVLVYQIRLEGPKCYIIILMAVFI